MHDYILAHLMVQEIEREFDQKQLQKHDPDGLAQYHIWDEAFARPTFIGRLKGLFAPSRSGESREAQRAPQHRAAECLPQG